MTDKSVILAALQDFAEAVTAKMNQATPGEPEDQLRAPLETFMQEVGQALSLNVVCTGETRLANRLGIPDFAVHDSRLLTGYVELKAPGVGADPRRFTGHNRQQWKRFQAIPNLIYCDGNEWGLYRDGKAVRPLVRLSGDVTTDGKNAAAAEDVQTLVALLTDFFSWEPILPTKLRGGLDLKAFAVLLAPLCRMLRDDVADALKDEESPLVQLARDWRQLLFPDADDDQFADAYAQTVTFALLLARSEGADPLSLASAEATLAGEHGLLSRALQVLTDENAQAEISAALNLLLRIVSVVPPKALAGPEDPWLYFYEDFLAAYDPELRRDAGAYYTPVEVVRAQVRLVDDLLTNRLGKPLGFADSEVVTLDPAVGTGTYLLGVIQHALDKMEARHGPGAVPGQATGLAKNIYGFEIMVGPFAVSELRVSRALVERGATLPRDGTHVYLTDTLENPRTTPPQLALFLKPIADQHRRALEVKDKVPVIVCLGNPPYDRHEAADDTNRARTGGWVRWGDSGKGSDAILGDFLQPALDAGHGVHVKNLYNLYVYFWRWAVWKVFEHSSASGPGVVSFISASSYLDGDAFSGMREHLRRVCDEIWILDLGGEGRGTRQSENVFAIQTPVAIAVVVNYGKRDQDAPATVHYARIEGTRQEKLQALGAIKDLASLTWEDCPDGWQSPFQPAGKGRYFDWPLLTDLMPWQQSGVKAGRTWVISPEEETLRKCWHALLNAERDERKRLFKNSPTGRKIHEAATQLPPSDAKLRPISELVKGSRSLNIVRFAYRSFDRQLIFADARLLDRAGPRLWRAHSDRQLYLTSLLTKPLGAGPALTASALIPDLDHFSGRGARDVVPMYRDAGAREPNIVSGLLDVLSAAYEKKISPEDFLAYVYGTLSHPAFTARYGMELATRELRVPMTKDAVLFARVRDVGAKLLWLHTYGERFVPRGKKRGQIPRGAARCLKAVDGSSAGYPESFAYEDGTETLRVGDGEFRPVAREVFEFEVSGLEVVQSWLRYRMKRGAGRKSSPLDDIRPERWTNEFTTELLELLWVLEATIAEYPVQAELLSTVVEGPCFSVGELPAVPDSARKPPSQPRQMDLYDLAEEE